MDWTKTAGVLVGLLFSLAAHESAHAWVAEKLGDPTGRLLGRITLNPVPHIDLFGTIVMPLLLLYMTNGRWTFMYAKPVPYNPLHLKNPGTGSALIAGAGPLTNLLIAFGLAFAVVLVGKNPALSRTLGFDVLLAVFAMNVGLAVFNLLPLPPLDGSKVFAAVLPSGAQAAFLSLDRFGFLVLILLSYLGVIGRVILPAIDAIAEAFLRAAGANLG